MKMNDAITAYEAVKKFYEVRQPTPCLKEKWKEDDHCHMIHWISYNNLYHMKSMRSGLSYMLTFINSVVFMLIESSRIKYIDLESITSQAMASIVPRLSNL